MGQSMGLIEKNTTDGLLTLANKYSHKMAAPYIFVHPLYVQLQMASPMGMMRDFNVSEVDMQNSTIGKHEFY
jgi:hypothetical protein